METIPTTSEEKVKSTECVVENDFYLNKAILPSFQIRAIVTLHILFFIVYVCVISVTVTYQ